MTTKSAKEHYVYEWYVVAICMLAYIFSFVDRQVLSLLVEPIKRDLALTDLQFSLLHGLAFSIFYAVMGLPIARMADRYSRPLIISIGIFFWSMATVACGFGRNFLHMFLARIGVGVGEAALSPAAYSMLSDYFPKHLLGRALGVYSIGSFIGIGLAFLIGGYVISLVGDMSEILLPVLGAVRPWQITFFLVGFPGVLIALLFLITVKDPRRKGLQVGVGGEITSVSMAQTFRFISKHKSTFFCHYLGFSFYAMAMFAVLSWLPAFYMRQFALSATEVGYILGVIILLANSLGVFSAGWLSDWLLKKGHQDAPMRAGVIGAAGLLIPVALFPIVNELWLSLSLLVVTMFFVSFPMPTSTMAMQMLAPNQMRAQISAVFLLISNLIGLGLGASLVALLTDKVFHSELMVGKSMAIVASCATILTILLLWRGGKYFRNSLATESYEN